MKVKGTEDNRLVRVVLDNDGYLIQAGDPNIKITTKELRLLTESGCQFITMTIAEFRAKNYAWIYKKLKP